MVDREDWVVIAAGGLPLCIKDSPGKGLGVFSTCKIQQGHFLGCYRGELLGEEELERREGDGEYLFDLKDGLSMDASDAGKANWTRYLNHSKTHKNLQPKVERGAAYMMVTCHGDDENGGWEAFSTLLSLLTEFLLL